jgi:hypothetical protein
VPLKCDCIDNQARYVLHPFDVDVPISSIVEGQIDLATSIEGMESSHATWNMNCSIGKWPLLELEIKHKHGGFNLNYEKATVVWQQFGFGL